MKFPAETDKLLCADDAVLVMMDMQTRLGSAMPESVYVNTKTACKKLLQAADAFAIPTLITEQYPRGLRHTEPELTAQLPAVCETFEKQSFSAFAVPQFMQALEITARKQIILCGMETHICVLQTALELRVNHYDIHLVSDAVCSRSKANYSNAIARLRQNGIQISNTESILFECLRSAKHSAFKTISALVR